MSTRKNSTNRTAATSSTTTNNNESPNAQLARQISAILNNPNIPTSIYDALADEVTAIHARLTHAEIDSPQYILMVLDQHDRAQVRRA